jgi:signal transduction histidine kinase
LPLIRHGPKIMNAWRGFKRLIDELMATLDESRTWPAREFLADVRGALAKLEGPVKKMAIAQQQIESWRDPGREPVQIPDLAVYLDRLIADWNAKANFVETSISLRGRLALPCDPVILDNTLRLLIENAGSVSPRDRDGRFRIALNAYERDDIYPFAKLVTIEIKDFGPGIHPKNVPFLFIDGYSDRRGLVEYSNPDEPHVRHKGLGLGMARAFLLRASGELLLKDHGWPNRGATFAMHFGLGTQSPLNTRSPKEARV